MSVVSSPSSSSSASTFPPPTTTTSANNDGKASEEKVEEDVVSELEQRVKDVEEDTILRFGEKSDATKSVTKSASSSSKQQSASSTLLFAKLASLRSALVDSRTRFIAAKNSGKENEIKRLHDRLEKVLFQIAVVGVLKREDEKNGYQSVPFGRSARAIARDCLVLTFSFGNR
jgi:predicted transcriptional regulator